MLVAKESDPLDSPPQVSALFMSNGEGEGYVLALPGCDWAQIEEAFDLAAALGYMETDLDGDGPDEPEALPDGSLRFWLYSPSLYLEGIGDGPLWLS